MVDLLKRALGHGIELQLSFPSAMPPVLADANQLELALLNLALNARDAMPDGRQLTVGATAETQSEFAPRAGSRADACAAGDYVRISIADTGVGMDEVTLAKATEPFFTTKGPGKGTGLGLSMVHGLAAQSGGLLRIRSKPNMGTRIELWLPRATTSAVSVLRAPKPTELAPRTAPCKVLIVDDDLLVIDGDGGVDRGPWATPPSRRTRPRKPWRSWRPMPRSIVVITDYAMPTMTGLQLAQCIQDRFPGLPIILATGYAELPLDPAKMGLLKLTKPCSQQDIAACIHKAMRPRAEVNEFAEPTAARN